MAWVSLDNLTRFYTKLKEKMYLKTEVDTKLSGKANSSHTHDDRYYTESEINTKISELNSNITSNSGLKTYAINTRDILAQATNLAGPLGQSMSYTATKDCYFILINACSNSGNGRPLYVTIDDVSLHSGMWHNDIGYNMSCFLKAGQKVSITCGYWLCYKIFGLK